MEKNKLLKISSILLIVFGVILALLAIIFFAAGDFVAAIIDAAGADMGDLGVGADVTAAAVKMVVTILGVVLLVEGVAYIAAGVVGVKQKSEKTCFVVAIVLVVIAGIGAITNIVEGQVFSAILGLVVPVLYLVGAIQLKKSVENETSESFDNTTM